MKKIRTAVDPPEPVVLTKKEAERFADWCRFKQHQYRKVRGYDVIFHLVEMEVSLHRNDVMPRRGK